MRINLRKAAVVQQAIQDELKRDRDEATALRVSVFDNEVKFTLDAQVQKIEENLARTERLLKALYTLRQIVARKNAESGITDGLAEEAHLSARESQLNELAKADVRPNETTLVAELMERRTGKTESLYGGRDFTVPVPVMPQAMQDRLKKDLAQIRRLRRRIRDDMVSINVKTEVEVPEEVSRVLTELGLD